MPSLEIRTKYKNSYFKLEYICEFHNIQYILLLIIVFLSEYTLVPSLIIFYTFKYFL